MKKVLLVLLIAITGSAHSISLSTTQKVGLGLISAGVPAMIWTSDRLSKGKSTFPSRVDTYLQAQGEYLWKALDVSAVLLGPLSVVLGLNLTLVQKGHIGKFGSAFVGAGLLTGLMVYKKSKSYWENDPRQVGFLPPALLAGALTLNGIAFWAWQLAHLRAHFYWSN
jgi:hypothetical protein